MRLKEIEARLAEIKGEIETRGADLNAEQLKSLEDEVKALQEERKALMEAQEKRTALLDSLANNGVATDDDGTITASKVVRSFKSDDNKDVDQRGADDMHSSMEYRKAFMAYVTRGTAIPAEYRADATSKTTDVGAAIPTTVLNQIIDKLEKTGTILARVTRTAYKGGVSIPVSTVKPVATWTAEGAGSDKQRKNVGTVTFTYHKLRCAVAVSFEVDTMAIAAFESLIISNIVEAMTKALEQSIVSGTGNGQPKGITAETPVEGQTVTVSELAYNDLINAEAALPSAYEREAIWTMNKKTFMGYIGIVDENGQPIARVNHGLNGKIEYFLLGREVEVNDYLPSFANAEEGITFGYLFNYKDYVLNTNYAMGVKKYEDNDNDDVVTKGIMLADGKVVDKNSYVPLVKDAQEV